MNTRLLRCRGAFARDGLRIVTGLLLLAGSATALAAEPVPPKKRDLFEIHVRPTLVRHCLACHGPAKQEGGLRLTSRAHLLRGGDSGPAIVPGKPDASLMVEALRYESLEMPPTGQLPGSVATGIAAWIRAGAPWPRGLVLKPTPKRTGKDRDWWCYKPLGNPAVPAVNDQGWCRNEIDHFIFRRLQQAGLRPAAEADARTLTRRVHFAITGLPPDARAKDAGATDAGTGDSTSDAYEKRVDRLLQNSAYGENQARYWLDLVRYADSDGYNADHARPEAHLYRDYVIRSFNADKPYDRFVLEQLAGDEIDPGNRDALIATMYLRHWIYEWNQRDVEGQWQQILSDVTETTADVFLAQGLKCARCHDHKFDPLLQRDYFAFKAFFTPLQPREDQPIADVPARADYLQHLRTWQQATAAIRAELHAIERPVLLAHATREGFVKFTKSIQSMIAARPETRTPYAQQIASLASNQFDVHPDKLPKWLDKRTEARRQALRKQLAKFDHLKPSPLPTLKFAVSDVGPIAPPTTIPGSDDSRPIPPGVPQILAAKPLQIRPVPEALQSTGRRSALARWIASRDNPLTARVLVNRIWRQHFGRGLVETTSDFGRLGTPPSHPELLDWLARRFVEEGWSLKKLHRLILTSATFRQSTDRPHDPQAAKRDPQNVLLWRMNPRRLAAEEIHDCLLAASGEIAGGKRAIYKPVKRNRLDPLLAAFDFPDRVESQGRRHRTTTSPQALLLMNDPWLQERARKMAAQLSGGDFEAQVRAAYGRLYFRAPRPEELAEAARFVKAYASLAGDAKPERSVLPFPSGGKAASFAAKPPPSVQIGPIKTLYAPDGKGTAPFTIEVTVLLRSLYPDASVRTIVANWSDKKTERGWSLGVTSAKSAYRPRNLILQLIAPRGSDRTKPQYEVVASHLRLELNRPYHVAVSIDPADTSKKGITFFLRDLSRPKAPPRIAQVAHQATGNPHAKRPIEIGGRGNRHRWDGLIQSVRLHPRLLTREEFSGGAAPRPVKPRPEDRADADPFRPLFDVRLADEKTLGRDRSGNDRHAAVRLSGDAGMSPRQRAQVALLHALMCSNETIYVD